MPYEDIPVSWGTQFGLAVSPLFGSRESVPAGSHHVLSDGGSGSLALSFSPEPIWKERLCADWSWSSNLPHHVTITDDEVAVTRWDRARPELFRRDSVESRISAFYSYLASDRVESNKRVVDFMLDLYRSLRSLVAHASIEDERSVDAFISFLRKSMLKEHRRVGTQSLSTCTGYEADDDILGALSTSGVDALLETTLDRDASALSLRLVPSLAIRHAGSEIFQEAHFELLRAPSPDLFGNVGPAEIAPITRGGAHFTPPTLARTVVEQTLLRISDLVNRTRLVILDPACGSGAFLHEALRALRREDYDGEVVLVGRDTSRAAVSMAKFVLANAVSDWSPAGGCQIRVDLGDSLCTPLPPADIVLMNPPFVSWIALAEDQRARMRDVLGSELSGQGDYSMAFVSRAIDAVRPGGALGTLIPGSLSTLQGSSRWRDSILERADLRFIASLGDYGLFRYAQVHVSAAVFSKPMSGFERSYDAVALTVGNIPEATSSALRNLRQVGATSFGERSDNGWHLFETSSRIFRDRPTWRLITPSTETALHGLTQSGRVAPIGDLFSVRQGVQTGMNKVFLISNAELKRLPERERVWFRPASINESIQNGAITPKHHVFYPYDKQGLSIRDEDMLTEKLPVYNQEYLRPNRVRLSRRAAIVRSGRADWWGLSWRRSWSLDREPRIVSKYFGGPGSFAVDFDAIYVVVQGFAWLPKWEANQTSDEEDTASPFGLGMRDMLAAFSVILNSEVVARLLSTYSQHVAGGQYDLSWRFVKHIPVPNLPTLMSDERDSYVVVELAHTLNKRGPSESLRRRTEQLVAELYGPRFVQEI